MAKGTVNARGGGRSTRSAPRGRGLVAFVLLAFLVVATGVIARRSYGIAQARALRDLDRERVQLESRRTQLQRDIRDASSRVRLQKTAEQALGMRVPADSQVIILAPGATRAR
ncbi:MAG: cell division protein FtsL [Gemmatimonadaceae bacterium]|nr:cell division protein FtsL [Gemmatimonadaceae bacterium]